MRKIIVIKSNDNTDVIIFVDSIQYVIQNKNGCVVGLDNGARICTSAAFEDIRKTLEKGT